MHLKGNRYDVTIKIKMNKSLVAAFAALSAPVISLTAPHKWEHYDQSTHVPLWRDPSFANGFK